MVRKKLAVLSFLIAVMTLFTLGACTPSPSVPDATLEGKYTLKTFSITLGADKSEFAPSDAEATKYLSIVKIYGLDFTADSGKIMFNGTGFLKDTVEAFTVSGSNVVFDSASVNELFRTFRAEENKVTVEINSAGLLLTLVYETEATQIPDPEPTP